MLDLEEARRLAQAYVGTAAKLTHSPQPPEGMYIVHPGRDFYFFVGRPTDINRVGSSEVAIVNRLSGEIRTSWSGE